MTGNKSQVAVAEGDGIGPEIMAATLEVLKAAGAPLEFHHIEIGEKVYLQGERSGIAPSSWEIIRGTQAFLKAPITTPQGGGFKSLNVTVRTALGLYANIRPCISYAPFVQTKHPKMDLVIVRENEEDLYTGIEYRQSKETTHALKIITYTGSEKIIRYAFDYARANKRKKVTCFTKDNILKITDGLFHKIFEEVAKEYPEIEKEHWIVDIGAAKLADTPELFDVIVMPNLYGDILSDVAAQISGSVGLAGSANIGKNGAMFEAIHGSAPRRAGQNAANPSGLLLASVMMLVHLGHAKQAALIHNAWLKTIEDGIHTYDIFKKGASKQLVGTKEFAKSVSDSLGKKPSMLKEVNYSSSTKMEQSAHSLITQELKKKKKCVGIDCFIHWSDSLDSLETKLQAIQNKDFTLAMIANRGTTVWPTLIPETSCSDIWRCRFTSKAKQPFTQVQVAELMMDLAKSELECTQMQQLCTFDGIPGYTLSQQEQ